MINIYFIYISKCNLVYIVLLMCKDTYVPHTFLLQMFITYYIYVCYIYKRKKRCREEKHVTFEKYLKCFNSVLN